MLVMYMFQGLSGIQMCTNVVLAIIKTIYNCLINIFVLSVYPAGRTERFVARNIHVP